MGINIGLGVVINPAVPKDGLAALAGANTPARERLSVEERKLLDTGLRQSARGEVADLGDFTQFIGDGEDE